MSKNIKKESLNFYRQWMKTECFCPAFKECVKITWLGWNHLVGNKNNKNRSWNDTYRRLKLLCLAKEVIEESTTVQNIIKKNGKIYFILEAMKLITIKKYKKWCKVRVVLIQDKKMKKIFLSVMPRK